MCGAVTAAFGIQDVRRLDERKDLFEGFDVAILCEVIEHILDDAKLIRDAAGCVKPGGRLLLTTPNLDLKPIDPKHEGPFPTVEDGGHVRKGYTKQDLLRLCDQAGLIVDSVSYCTGVVSQKITQVYFKLSKIHPLLGWGLISPFRLLPPLVDEGITKLSRYPKYSICLEARKPCPAAQPMKPYAPIS
jgi:SAM-dependent methyltransferase